MDFIDNVDLVPRRYAGIAHRLDDLADIVDAGIRCGVHLDDVHVPPRRNGNTRLAAAARCDRRSTATVRADAIERLGDNPRCRCLADAAHPGQQPGLSQPIARNGIGKRLHHGVLPEQRVEAGGTVFARQNAISGGECSGLHARKGEVFGHWGGDSASPGWRHGKYLAPPERGRFRRLRLRFDHICT